MPWSVTHFMLGLPHAAVRGLLAQVYSLHESMEAVVKFVETVDPERAKKAKLRYSCFDKCGSPPLDACISVVIAIAAVNSP